MASRRLRRIDSINSIVQEKVNHAQVVRTMDVEVVE